MIVVDTNILVYLFIQGPKSALARDLLRKDPRWLLPTLWRHEFLNVLVTHIHTKRLSLEEAEEIWGRAIDLLKDSEKDVSPEVALHLSAECRVTGYDAQFIALAQAYGTVCLSEDNALRRNAPLGLVRTLEEFLHR